MSRRRRRKAELQEPAKGDVRLVRGSMRAVEPSSSGPTRSDSMEAGTAATIHSLQTNLGNARFARLIASRSTSPDLLSDLVLGHHKTKGKPPSPASQRADVASVLLRTPAETATSEHRRLFEEAIDLQRRAFYQRAIDLYWQVAEMEATPRDVREAAVFNIGQATWKQAESFFESGEYAPAIVSFERMRRLLHPELAKWQHSALWNIGLSNFRLERFDSAIVYFQRYLQGEVSDERRGRTERLLAEARQKAGIAPAGDEPVAKDELDARFAAAEQDFADGRFAQAALQFEGIRQTPGATDSLKIACLWNIGQAHLRLQRFATAIIYFEDYIAAGGSNLDGASRNIEKAAEEGGVRAPKLSLEQQQSLSDAAAALYASGRYAEAIIQFERLRQAPGTSEEAKLLWLWNIASSHWKLGRLQTAIAYFEKYIADGGPDIDGAAKSIAKLREMAGASLPAVSRDEQQSLVDAAAELYKSGKFAEAIVQYERLRQSPGVLDETKLICLWNIASSHWKLGRFERAIAYFEKYISEGGPDVDAAAKSIAILREKAGKPQEELSPEKEESMGRSAGALYRADRFEEAIIAYERLRQSPGVSDHWRFIALWNIASCDWRLGRLERAIFYLEKYIAEGGPDINEAASTIANLRHKAGASLPELSQAQQQAMVDSAAALYASGRFMEAIIQYERLRQSPGASNDVKLVCLWNIASCHWKLDRIETAIAYFEKYVAEGGPDAAQAKKVLDKLREKSAAAQSAASTSQ